MPPPLSNRAAANKRGGALSPCEQTVFNALCEGPKTVCDLIDIVYAGAKDGGPEDAVGCIKQFIHGVRRKTDIKIKCRSIYGIES